MILRSAIAILLLFVQPFLGAAVVYVKTGRLIVDATQPAIVQGAVVITDGTISAVGANLAQPVGAVLVDLGKYTVLPSIIDAHCHLWTGAFLQTPSPAYASLKAAQAVGYAVQSGVSAMRVLGG